MIEIANVNVPLDAGLPGGDRLLRRAAARRLGVSGAAIADVRVLKRSVDARSKKDVHFVVTLGVQVVGGAEEEDRVLASRSLGRGVKRHARYEPLAIPDCSRTAGEPGYVPPIVVGMGPAGLFAALYLARAGMRPIVLERGASVEERAADVAAFNAGGPLDPESNVQFGEGGAGTFSDGKLTTNTKNPYTKHVLRWFADAGAPEEILWQAHPHIGSDRLPSVVAAMREEIKALGGDVRFCTRLTNVRLEAGRVVSVDVEDRRAGARATLPARQVVVACGHSARDVFGMLHEAGLPMERKPFSAGVRIEHPQRSIDRAQWGAAADHPALGAAEYKLAVHLGNGRGVYTFCMCPGGEVVCAASEPGGVVVNGMSNFARDGRNANSALLVGVDPEDFGEEGVLAGVEFQRRLERAAYAAGCVEGSDAAYRAPAQTVGDFLAGRSGSASSGVKPTYARGVTWCDLRQVLPAFVADAIAEALPLLDRRLRGFAHPQAVMTAVETRSSSPVRIVREEDRQAWVAEGAGASPVPSGVYPCGEGAGYAGGIMSAAVDGLRSAEALARSAC